jgi:hypothetical protein
MHRGRKLVDVAEQCLVEVIGFAGTAALVLLIHQRALRRGARLGRSGLLKALVATWLVAVTASSFLPYVADSISAVLSAPAAASKFFDDMVFLCVMTAQTTGAAALWSWLGRNILTSPLAATGESGIMASRADLAKLFCFFWVVDISALAASLYADAELKASITASRVAGWLSALNFQEVHARTLTSVALAWLPIAIFSDLLVLALGVALIAVELSSAPARLARSADVFE